MGLSVGLLTIIFLAASRVLLEDWARNDTVWAAIAALLLVLASALVLPFSRSDFAFCAAVLLLPIVWWTPFITRKGAAARAVKKIGQDKPKCRITNLESNVLDGSEYKLRFRAVDEFRSITVDAVVNAKCGNIQNMEYRLVPSGVLY